jgi:hypothetical protein
MHNKEVLGLCKEYNNMRKNLLNWCNLVSISKKLMFYAFGAVTIYEYLADLLQEKS